MNIFVDYNIHLSMELFAQNPYFVQFSWHIMDTLPVRQMDLFKFNDN